MPVTIGTMTSDVNVREPSATVDDDMVERISRIVLARVRAMRRDEEQGREEREIRDRMSRSDPF